MENRERDITKEQIIRAIGILRKVTIVVKVAPFIYATIFLLCMIGYVTLSDGVISVLDMLFYVSPITCITFIRLSYLLKLCNWYRLQCCLPMFPLPFIIIDEYVNMFQETAVVVHLSLTIVIFLLSLINTYFVFIKK